MSPRSGTDKRVSTCKSAAAPGYEGPFFVHSGTAHTVEKKSNHLPCVSVYGELRGGVR